MLAFAVTTFFIVTLVVAISIIALMFASYHDKIKTVVLGGVDQKQNVSAKIATPYRDRKIKPQHLMVQHRSLQPVLLRAAA